MQWSRPIHKRLARCVQKPIIFLLYYNNSSASYSKETNSYTLSKKYQCVLISKYFAQPSRDKSGQDTYVKVIITEFLTLECLPERELPGNFFLFHRFVEACLLLLEFQCCDRALDFQRSSAPPCGDAIS